MMVDRTPRRALTAGAILLIALVAFGLALETASPPASASGVRPVLGLPATTHAAERATLELASDAPAASAARTTRSVPIEDEPDGAWIRVVDARGRPVEGIPVGLWITTPSPEQAALTLALEALTARQERVAVQLRTLEQFEVATRAQETRVRLESVRRWTEIATSQEVDLRLQLDRLQVMRANRLTIGERPRTEHDPPAPHPVHGLPAPAWRGTTNEDGLVRVTAEFAAGATARATFDFPTLVDHSVAWPEPTPDEPRTRIATLVLPELERHVVHFTDDLPGAEERRWRGRMVVVRTREGEARHESSEDVRELAVRETWLVERGVNVQVHAHLSQGFCPVLVVPLIGAPWDGEARPQDVRASDFLAHVALRVLDPLGNPLQAAEAHLIHADAATWSPDGGGPQVEEAASPVFDEEGVTTFLLDARPRRHHHRYLRLRQTVSAVGTLAVQLVSGDGRAQAIEGRIVELVQGQAGQDRTAEVVLTNPSRLRFQSTTRRGPEPEDPSPHAWLDLTTPYGPGTRNDLGTITLGAGAWILEGVVVDEAGAPLADAVVRVSAAGARGRAVAAQATDARGVFRIRGLTPWSALAVDVQIDGHRLPERAEFPTGSTGVRLVVRRCGSVQVHASVPHPLPLQRRTLTLVLNSHETGRWQSEPLTSEPSSVIDGLAPGTYDVGLCLHGTFVTPRQTLVVRGGETTACSFAEVDLARAIVPLTLRVEDADGTPLAGRKLRVRAMEDARHRTTPTYATNRDGLETFFVPASWTDLRVELLPGGTHPVRLTVERQTVRPTD